MGATLGSRKRIGGEVTGPTVCGLRGFVGAAELERSESQGAAGHPSAAENRVASPLPLSRPFGPCNIRSSGRRRVSAVPYYIGGSSTIAGAFWRHGNDAYPCASWNVFA